MCSGGSADQYWIEKAIGKNVVGKDGEVSTKSIADSVEMVSVYFSAHWCPPCRGFTPVLAETYKKVNATEKRWEVIFLSSDRDESSFNEYFAEMPWKALPYAERDTKAKLSKKFKVSGIPMLLHLDPKTGEILNKEGRASVSGDPEGAKFPWINKPKAFWDILGNVEIEKKGVTLTADDLKKKDYIAIYFSAHWCPPCRGFTPNLNKWYEQYFKDSGNFEMIFNSWDRDEASFNDYYKDMPFATRKWADKSVKEDLDKLFEVNGIPSLVVVDAKTGKLVTAEGRAGVSSRPEEFPWEKQPVGVMGGSVVSSLNETPCVIAHCSKADGKSAMMESAMVFVNKLKAEGEWPGEMDIEFIVDDGSDDLSARVKGLIKRTDEETLYILSLSERAVYTLEEAADGITADAVKKLVAGYQDKDKTGLKKRTLVL